MLLKEKRIIIEAQNNNNFMDELLQTEDAEKFIKYVIKSYTKKPALFMRQHHVEWEDLYQSCLIGLFNGIKKIEVEKSPNEWVRYLYLSIQGEIRSFARSNNSNSLRISQRIRAMYPKYLVFHNSYHENVHRDPTIKETMKEFNITKDEAFDLVYGTQELVSIYQTNLVKERRQTIDYYSANPFPNVEWVTINKIMMEAYMKDLSPVQRKVINMHYLLGFKKSEVAEAIGCSNPMVQKHITNAFNKIRGSA